MTQDEIDLLTALFGAPMPDADLEAYGWSDLAAQLQRRSLVQHDPVGQQTEITWVGRMMVPR